MIGGHIYFNNEVVNIPCPYVAIPNQMYALCLSGPDRHQSRTDRLRGIGVDCVLEVDDSRLPVTLKLLLNLRNLAHMITEHNLTQHIASI